MYRDATELWGDRLEVILKEDLEKEGSDENPATSTDPKDETRSTVGTTNLYADPVDHESGSDDPEQHGSGVKNKAVETQKELLDKAFSGTAMAAKADQQLISANFAHGASGDFESRQPLLQSKSRIEITKEPTLMEKVRAATGRH